ncbi:MAG TPA: cyclic peptide export ABC transporter [Bryobacteraceae bacterium]|jgi:putative ATP-binding cassette transporter|nr:cyclic peptide export ABC transporter [Bryobacteraceae bacterium]
MDLLAFLYKQSRRMLFAAIAAGILSGIANIGLLAVIGSAVTRANRNALLPIFAVLCVVAPAAYFTSQTLVVHLAQAALQNLRSELADRILAVPLAAIEQLGIHRITAAFTDDITQLSKSIGLVPVMCINAGAILSCFVYMASLDLKIFAYLLLFIVCGVLSYHFALSRSLSYLWRARQDDDDVHRHLRTLVTGIKELKLHRERRRGLLEVVLRPAMKEARAHNIAGLRIFAIAASWGELLLFLALGCLVFLLSALPSTTPRVMVGFSFALLYLIGPLQMVMNSMPELGKASVAVRSLSDMGLSLPPEHEPETDFPVGPAGAGTPLLEARGIVYAYTGNDPGGDSRFALGPLDLSVHEGELVFITGGNGSGKTTLAKVLTGLYAPQFGRLFMRGIEVMGENRDGYRQNFAAIFADCVIFDRLLGLDAPDLDERATKYLAELQLTEKVQVRDGALSTTELSQGQRKRLALLTSWLEDRPIYFFDEWAADQDPAFRDVFYHEVLPGLQQRGKTTIVITHDDRYFHLADRIIKLESGVVASETVCKRQSGAFS